MTTVKIYGAGSIGNHLANAARSKGWAVTVCDVDGDALERMRNEIYPSRYGQWDEGIRLCHSDEEPRGEFDYIFVGTPPDSHVQLALAALEEGPKAILVEKPFATPDLSGCQDLHDQATRSQTRVFVGYDHVVANSIEKAARAVADGGRDGGTEFHGRAAELETSITSARESLSSNSATRASFMPWASLAA